MFILQGQPVPLLSLAYLLSMGEADVAVAGDTVLLMMLRVWGQSGWRWPWTPSWENATA